MLDRWNIYKIVWKVCFIHRQNFVSIDRLTLKCAAPYNVTVIASKFYFYFGLKSEIRFPKGRLAYMFIPLLGILSKQL